MQPDPYEAYLKKAERLFVEGDIVQAGQIWQAILKKVPDHMEARAGLAKVKGIFEARAGQAPASESQSSFAPPPVASVPAPSPVYIDPEEADRIIKDGCTLYDMGMLVEAMEKWKGLLSRDPDREDAKSYLEMAKRDLRAAHAAMGKSVLDVNAPTSPSVPLPPAFPAPAVGQPEATAPEQDFDQMRRHSSRPSVTNAPAVARDDSTRPIPVQRIYPEAKGPGARDVMAESVGMGVTESPARPPESVQAPAPQSVRQLPEKLKSLELDIPRLLRRPTVLVGVVGCVLMLYAVVFWFRTNQKDESLERRVAEEKASAQVTLGELLDLNEKLADIRKEGEYMLDDDPFISYYRAKELVRQSPLDPAAAKLMEQASVAMSEFVGKVAERDVDSLVAKGDLEAAQRGLMVQLAQAPDDALIKGQMARLCLVLAERFAWNDRLDNAEIQIRRGRSMFPLDKSWSARLIFLEYLKGLRENERKSWIQLLG